MTPSKSFALQWYVKCPFKNSIQNLLYRNYVLPLAIEDNTLLTKIASVFFQSKFHYYNTFHFKRHIKKLAKAARFDEDILKVYLFFEIERIYIDAGNYSDPYSMRGENNFSQNRFRDLSILQYCRNLQALSLTDCDIADFKALENFKKLTILEVRFNEKSFSDQIKNIETINGLKELEYLHLEAQNVDNIGHVNNQNIRFLNLSESNLAQIAQISPNPNLRLLDISGSKVKTLAGIEQFKNLEILVIKDIDVEDYSLLVSLQKLKYLIIYNVKSNSQQETKLIELQSALPNVKFIDTVSFYIPSIFHYKNYGGHFGSRKIEMFKSLDAALDRQLKWNEEHYLWKRE